MKQLLLWVITFFILSSEAAPTPDWVDDWIAGTGTWGGGPYDYDPVIIKARRKRSPDPAPKELPWWVDDWISGIGHWGGDYEVEYDLVVINGRRKRSPVPVPHDLE